MTKEQLQRLRAEFIELNEAVHSMRGNPRVTWQQEAPEYAETLALIEAEIRNADESSSAPSAAGELASEPLVPYSAEGSRPATVGADHWALKELSALGSPERHRVMGRDPECDHITADEVLLAFLGANGFKAIVDAWREAKTRAGFGYT